MRCSMHSRWCNQSYSKECTTYIFPFTHPCGVRQSSIPCLIWRGQFQSTHPRGVRQETNALVRASAYKFQSTHPRGVRRQQSTGRDRPRQFQSTHPRGVRPRCRLYRWQKGGFQSTHPRGVRQGTVCLFSLLRPISIHAPAWGATYPPTIRARRSHHFNPRTRVGCDI